MPIEESKTIVVRKGSRMLGGKCTGNIPATAQILKSSSSATVDATREGQIRRAVNEGQNRGANTGDDSSIGPAGRGDVRKQVQPSTMAAVQDKSLHVGDKANLPFDHQITQDQTYSSLVFRNLGGCGTDRVETDQSSQRPACLLQTLLAFLDRFPMCPFSFFPISSRIMKMPKLSSECALATRK
jgi:hypothetical protein